MYSFIKKDNRIYSWGISFDYKTGRGQYCLLISIETPCFIIVKFLPELECIWTIEYLVRSPKRSKGKHIKSISF